MPWGLFQIEDLKDWTASKVVATPPCELPQSMEHRGVVLTMSGPVPNLCWFVAQQCFNNLTVDFMKRLLPLVGLVYERASDRPTLELDV